MMEYLEHQNTQALIKKLLFAHMMNTPDDGPKQQKMHEARA